MPLPPAPSELGAKLATTRTKASAREDAPRSETLEELRERIRARNHRPVEPAAAAPAEKATSPAPTKQQYFANRSFIAKQVGNVRDVGAT